MKQLEITEEMVNELRAKVLDRSMFQNYASFHRIPLFYTILYWGLYASLRRRYAQ
jgi:hypothetical protein